MIGDPSAGVWDRKLAERHLVAALLAAGQLDVARTEVKTHPFDPASTAQVERLVQRRAHLRWTGLIGAMALLALALAATAYARRAFRSRLPACNTLQRP